MLGKDRAYLDSLRLDMIDNGNFKSEYKTLWQSMPASFFKMKAHPKSESDGPGEPVADDDSSGSYEFLRNPSGYELNPEQQQFLAEHYNDYNNTDPYLVLEWLHGKALSYELELSEF